MSTPKITTAAPSSQAYFERGGTPSTLRPHTTPLGAITDFGSAPGNPSEASPLSQSTSQPNNGRFHEEWDASRRGSSILDGPVHRSNSVMSQGDTLIPTRGGTLKKKASLKRGSSLRRSGSRRSSRAGSVRSLALQPSGDIDGINSAFVSPVPTSGSPTDILANRFQGKQI